MKAWRFYLLASYPKRQFLSCLQQVQCFSNPGLAAPATYCIPVPSQYQAIFFFGLDLVIARMDHDNPQDMGMDQYLLIPFLGG
jgi:hypothetical protein